MRTRIVTSLEELNALSSDWQRLADNGEFPTIGSNYLFIRAWWRAFGKSLSLRVAVIEDGGAVRLIAPFYVNAADRQLRLVGDFWGDYSSIVFARGDRDSVGALKSWLGLQHDWDKLLLKYLPADSLLLEQYPSAQPSCTPFIRRLSAWAKLRQPPAYLDVYDSCPYLDLRARGDCSELLENRRYKRHIKWFNARGRLSYQCFTDRDTCLSLLPDFFALHRKEWSARRDSGNVAADQEMLGSWFDCEEPVSSSPLPLVPNRRFYQYLMEELCPRGMARFDVLSLDESPVAMNVCFVERGSLYGYRTCYDPEFYQHSPGRLLLCYSVRQALESGLQQVDLGFGCHSYKMDYASGVRRTGTLTIYRTAADAALEALKKATARVRG